MNSKGAVPTSSAGFLKVGPERQSVPKDKRTALIRKGNELFNAGNYDVAKRVFLTVGYSDGLIRLAHHYWNNQQPLEAFRLYWLAGDSRTVDQLTERMAKVIRKWMKE